MEPTRTRERLWQGPRLAFCSLFALYLLVVAWVLLTGRLPAWRIPVGLGALGLVLGVFKVYSREEVEIGPGVLRFRGPGRKLELHPGDVTGIQFSPTVAPIEGFERGAILEGDSGKIHLARYEDPELIWDAFQEDFLPVLADGLLSRMESGEAVALPGATLEWERLEVQGVRITWSDLEAVEERGDGFLILFRNHPADARAFTRREFPAALLLGEVLARLPASAREPSRVGSPWGPEQAQRWTRARPRGPFPASHPELGELLGTWSPEESGGLFRRLFGKGGGDLGFALYEKGVAAPEGMIRWGRVDSVAIELANRYQGNEKEGARRYLGRQLLLRIEGEGIEIQAADRSPTFEAICHTISRQVSAYLGPRFLDALQRGSEVSFGFASLSLEGIRSGGQELPWSAYRGHRIALGHRVEDDLEVPHLELLSHRAPRPVLQVSLGEPQARVFLEILRNLEAVGMPEKARARSEAPPREAGAAESAPPRPATPSAPTRYASGAAASSRAPLPVPGSSSPPRPRSPRTGSSRPPQGVRGPSAAPTRVGSAARPTPAIRGPSAGPTRVGPSTPPVRPTSSGPTRVGPSTPPVRPTSSGPTRVGPSTPPVRAATSGATRVAPSSPGRAAATRGTRVDSEKSSPALALPEIFEPGSEV